MMVEHKTSVQTYMVLSLVAVAMGMACSTNPAGSLRLGTDSSVFMYVARGMRELGEIPYRDAFDHKGPLIYLIDWIGLSLGPRYFGLWLIQVTLLFLDLILAFEIASLATDNKLVSLLTTMIFAAYVLGHFYGGNLTEEYALPMILASILIVARAHILGPPTWHGYHSVLLGALAMGTFLLKANLVAAWAILVPLMLMDRFRTAGATQAFRSAMFVAVGAVAALAPCLAYFGYHRALGDFYDSYWLFNFAYIRVTPPARLDALSHFGSDSTVALALFIGLTGLFRSRHRRLDVWLRATVSVMLLLSLLAVSLSGHQYGQYPIILAPCLILPYADLFGLLLGKPDTAGNKGSRLRNSLAELTLAVGTLVLLPIVGNSITATLDAMRGPAYAAHEVALVDHIQSTTAPDDPILVIGNRCWVYELASRRAPTKHFYQAALRHQPDQAAAFLDMIASGAPAVVIIPGVSRSSPEYAKLVVDLEERMADLIVSNVYNARTLSFGDYRVYERVR